MSKIFSKIVRKQCLHACDVFHGCSNYLLILCMWVNIDTRGHKKFQRAKIQLWVSPLQSQLIIFLCLHVQSCKVAKFQCCNVAKLRCCNVTKFQCCNVACYKGANFQCYNIAMFYYAKLQCFNVAKLQSCNVAFLHGGKVAKLQSCNMVTDGQVGLMSCSHS